MTENVADFAAERDEVLLFVLNKNLPPAARKQRRWHRSWTLGA